MKLRLFGRSLLLGSCWSFERMQGLGFAYALEPWLREVHGDGEALAEALKRHQGFFNTNLAASGIVLGVVAALEERIAEADASERPALVKRMARLKDTLSRSLAGIFDPLFVGVLKPFCAAAVLGLGVAVSTIVPLGASALLWAAGAYLAALSAPSLWLRFQGLDWGYQGGDGVAGRLKAVDWQGLIKRLRLAGLGVSALFLLALMVPYVRSARWAELVSAAAALGACLAARRWSVSAARIYGAFFALGLFLALGGRL